MHRPCVASDKSGGEKAAIFAVRPLSPCLWQEPSGQTRPREQRGHYSMIIEAKNWDERWPHVIKAEADGAPTCGVRPTGHISDMTNFGGMGKHGEAHGAR